MAGSPTDVKVSIFWAECNLRVVNLQLNQLPNSALYDYWLAHVSR